jgi:hypothetical protein
MGNVISQTEYLAGDKLAAGTFELDEVVLKSGEGAIVKGQVLAMEYSTGKYRKYNAAGSDGLNIARRVAYKAADSSLGDVPVEVVKTGAVVKTELKGVDIIVSTEEMATPAAPTTALAAGGTLTATTAFTYKVIATNAEGKTAPSGTSAKTTTAATAGKATSEDAYANIAAVNALLGDCSGTSKFLIMNVDGVVTSVEFDADYTGVGALANFAALIAKIDTAGTTTTTAADAAKIVITSDTTGAASKVEIVSDDAGLMGTAVEVAGVAEQRTINVGLTAVTGATGYKAYRSTDAFVTVSAARALTAGEVAALAFSDNGTLTWATEVAVAVTDNEAYAQLEWVGIDAINVNNGFTKRNV